MRHPAPVPHRLGERATGISTPPHDEVFHHEQRIAVSRPSQPMAGE
ncbi:MAG: hypothetical protein ACLFR7_11340 [Opitutales bacterium]